MEEHCGATSVAEELECAEQPQRQVLALGDRFRSYSELEDQLMSFESTTFMKFWKREARTIETARKRTVRPLNPRLKYYQLKFTCIHGGQTF